MKKINKLLLIVSLSCTASVALADSPTSPFACEAQAKLRTGNGIVQQYQCPANALAWVQLGDGQNVAFCMTGNAGNAPKNAPNSVCEVNPQYWVEYAPVRHVCQGTPEECAMDIY